MAATNDPRLAARMARLRTHGITRDPEEMVDQPHGPWYYEQVELGYNYRMTDLQAALGLSQLARLDEFVAARHRIAEHYDTKLSNLSIGLPSRDPQNYSALHLYVIQVEERDKVFGELRAAGIGANVHYIPVNRQPWHRGGPARPTPKADAYYARAISLPIYSEMTREQMDLVVSSLALAVG